MADNITAPGVGTVLAADDVGGIIYPRTKLAHGVDGSAVDASATDPLPVSLASTTLSGSSNAVNATPVASEVHVGQVGGYAINPSATITRPADTTAYASGDLVANSTTAGSVAYGALDVARKAAGSVQLIRLRLRKSNTSTTNASFRVHLYRSAPTFTNGDNGAWATNGIANYLGYFDITMDIALSDGAQGIYNFTTFPTIKLASGTSISWALEARAAYTPANAETFTLEVEAIQG
jgi:hypothetical protein